MDRRDRKDKRGLRQYAFPIFITLAVAFISISILLILLHHDPDLTRGICPDGNLSPSMQDVKLYDASSKTFNIELAKTPPAQEMGLSDRPCIPDNGAMLFLFASDDRFGIWMKDMRFPIDVVWLDKDKKVVTIDKNMKPDSYPKVYYPSDDARYVLEFKAGTIDELGAHTGVTFHW